MSRFPVFRRRVRSAFSILLLLGMLFLIWFFDQQDNRIDIAGKNIVVSDGDSFVIGRERVRLTGIDAPELHQSCSDQSGRLWPCGTDARDALAAKLKIPGLVCASQQEDRFHRKLVTCSTPSVADIGAAQIAEGWAISEEFGEGRDYPDQEDSARAEKRGIWRGSFERPRAWRNGHPRPL